MTGDLPPLSGPTRLGDGLTYFRGETRCTVSDTLITLHGHDAARQMASDAIARHLKSSSKGGGAIHVRLRTGPDGRSPVESVEIVGRQEGG